jgi:hypothetical protein
MFAILHRSSELLDLLVRELRLNCPKDFLDCDVPLFFNGCNLEASLKQRALEMFLGFGRCAST